MKRSWRMLFAPNNPNWRFSVWLSRKVDCAFTFAIGRPEIVRYEIDHNEVSETASFLMHIEKRVRLVIWFTLLVAAVGLLVLGFDSLRTKIADGYYDLTVELKCTGAAIVRTSAQAFMTEESADKAVEELKNDRSPRLKDLVVEPYMYVIADPYEGKPMRLRLSISEGGSPLRGYTDTQPEYLLVIADLSDGQRVFKVANIPNRKESRVMEVSVP